MSSKPTTAPAKDREVKRPTAPPPATHKSAPRYSTRRGDLERRNLTSREMRVRSKSYDGVNRSFVAVSSTETPAEVFDWERFEYVQEILVADGGEFPERCPLLDSHNRYRSVDVIGSAIEPKRVGEGWEQRGVFVEGDPEVDRIAVRVRDGHITDVSIGYEVLDFVDIPAGQTQEINGRSYTAVERTLRITTKWRVRELSITPIGADEKAKIRHQNQQGRASAPARIQRSRTMNPRLQKYLRSLGLAVNATDDEARSFHDGLSGLERTIANMLDHAVTDSAARTAADQMIRAAGFDPADPTKPLGAKRSKAKRGKKRRSEEEEDEERAEENEEDEEREFGEDEDEEREEDDDDAEERSSRRRGNSRSRRREPVRTAEWERERTRTLREMAGDVVPAATLQRAIDEGWTTGRAGPVFLQAIRDGRGDPLGADVGGRAPAGHSRNSVTNFDRDALCAAMMMRGSTGATRRGRIADPVRQRYVFDDLTGDMRFEDASKDDAWCRAVDRGYQLRGLPMVEIARRMLEQGGVRVDPIPSQVIRGFQRATAATIQGFAGIFTQTFGAIMLDSFLGTPDSTAQWTIERDNPNFLQNERHRVTKGRSLTKHAKGGEAEDYDLADVTEYTRIFRYSGKTAIDEIDLINDTMFDAMRGATPQEMGESGRRLRPDLVYAILMSNPNLQDGSALFNTTYGNLLGTATLNKANLQRGTTCIRTRRENNVNLDLEAAFLIVPQALWYDASELVTSASVVVAGDANIVRPTANALVGDALTVVADSRLDNGVTDPNSGTAIAGDVDDYYVASTPSRHTIEVTYLRGKARVPELRSGMLDRGQWGIWFDVKHDLGAKALGRAGLCKLSPTP